MAVQFVTIDRETPSLLPASVQDYIPENHLARFITEVVDQLDLRAIANQYSSGGSQAYPPHMMVALLFYGYATGVFSSRKLERATYDSLAFRYICANRPRFHRHFPQAICQAAYSLLHADPSDCRHGRRVEAGHDFV